jgi:hypothetical protein
MNQTMRERHATFENIVAVVPDFPGLIALRPDESWTSRLSDGDAGVVLEVMRLGNDLMPTFARILLAGTPDRILAAAQVLKDSMPAEKEERDPFKPVPGRQSITTDETRLDGFAPEEPTARLLRSVVAATMTISVRASGGRARAMSRKVMSYSSRRRTCRLPYST